MSTDTEHLPMHHVRPASGGPGRGRKGLARSLVEELLQEATGPLTIASIADRTGLAPAEVGRLLAKMLYLGTVHRPGGVVGRYALGPAPAEPEATAGPTPQSPALVRGATVHPATTTSQYDGRELQPFAGRPGAMDAFALPSRVGSQRLERRAPSPIGSQPPERATW